MQRHYAGDRPVSAVCTLLLLLLRSVRYLRRRRIFQFFANNNRPYGDINSTKICARHQQALCRVKHTNYDPTPGGWAYSRTTPAFRLGRQNKAQRMEYLL